MTLGTAPTEADSERDGALSYISEWHALILGFVTGFVAALSGSWALAGVVVAVALGVRAARLKALKEIRKEPWYALGGIPIGAAVGIMTQGVL